MSPKVPLTALVLLALAAGALGGNQLYGDGGAWEVPLAPETAAQCPTAPPKVGATKKAELDDYVNLFMGLVETHGVATPHMLAAMIRNHLRVMEMPVGSDLFKEVTRILEGRNLDLNLPDSGAVRSFIDEIATCASQNPFLLKFLKTLWAQWGSERLDEPYQVYTDKEKAMMITEAVTYAFVLDRLTKAARYNPHVLHGMKAVFAAKIDVTQRDKYFEEAVGPLTDSFLSRMRVFDKMMEWNLVAPPHTNLFEKVKKFGIDLAIDGILGYTEDAAPLEDNGFRTGLPINILEAVLEDYRLGNFDNGDAGMSMVLNGPEQAMCDALGNKPISLSTDGNAVWLFPYLPKQYADIYSTWNMAFVSHYPNAPLFYGKLFNPQVLCYEEAPQEYLHNRIIALWLHIYMELFSRVDRGTKSHDQDWSSLQITRLWAEVNAESGIEYSEMVDVCKAVCTDEMGWSEPANRDINLMIEGAKGMRINFHKRRDVAVSDVDDVMEHVNTLRAERDAEFAQNAPGPLPPSVVRLIAAKNLSPEEVDAYTRRLFNERIDPVTGQRVLKGGALRERTQVGYGLESRIDEMKDRVDGQGGRWLTEEFAHGRRHSLENEANNLAIERVIAEHAGNPQGASPAADADLVYADGDPRLKLRGFKAPAPVAGDEAGPGYTEVDGERFYDAEPYPISDDGAPQ